jgi:hypothetical protein
MNEAERLAYLNAMGIDTYVPRKVLPGAMPSPVYEAHCAEPVRDEIAEIHHKVTLPSPLKVLQEGLQPSPPASRSRQKTTAATSPASLPAASGATKIHVRFHWGIFQPVPPLLALLPLAHTDATALSLLRKILASIGVPDVPLLAREEFVWPPQRSAAPGSVASSHLDDARETLHAFLEGWQLKQQASAPLRHVLVFDGNLGKTVFEGLSWPGVQVSVLPGLHTMLNSTPEKIAEAKRFTWQSLKELKI